MVDMRVAGCLVLLMLWSGSSALKAAPLDEAAERYRPYMIEGIGDALAGARELRERAAANDLAGAKKAWILARAGWERSEVFTAGFVPELDAQIDAWPNADSGFHAIEAKLFGGGEIQKLTEPLFHGGIVVIRSGLAGEQAPIRSVKESAAGFWVSI